ncbi:ABC transporter permease [Paenibacillus sp. JSM ZJ436]|uniref:Binding-protein-dependent transport systems inner membrane component n=1 Tax=Paenibacillus algicola TaxID=2565926 RepID=A0A4P8XGT8_9BACL|nr:ABC transporter permease subunit [Paenibacillus algicola]QCT01478.1 binding-protein-dependent transport systems inner membrane component [Paenibacillus algicola]
MNSYIKIWKKQLKRNWHLYLFVLPTLIYFIVFNYLPMYGLQIAFKNFYPSQGILGSEWVGFDHFERFFNSPSFWTIIKNTLSISLYELILFPLPILFALAINELRNGTFKKSVQIITYAPHFISVVVVAGIIVSLVHPATGIVNKGIVLLGGEPISFMTEPAWFKSIYVWSGTWQQLGWNSIIYIAALSAINPELHEAATIDGATRVQRIWSINLPGIMPTVIILLILSIGNFMSIGFEKVYLLQNQLNMESSEVIQTYVYRSGLLQAQYSFSAAVGLFNSVINLILLVTINSIARKVSQTSLW